MKKILFILSLIFASCNNCSTSFNQFKSSKSNSRFEVIYQQPFTPTTSHWTYVLYDSLTGKQFLVVSTVSGVGLTQIQ